MTWLGAYINYEHLGIRVKKLDLREEKLRDEAGTTTTVKALAGLECFQIE